MAKGFKTGGRVAGTPNKVTTAAREAFQMAFDDTGGPTALAEWARENRTEFYKLFARLIPVDVNATHGVTDTMAEVMKELAERGRPRPPG